MSERSAPPQSSPPSAISDAVTQACGLPAIEPPATKPLDACRDGAVVFGPARIERGKGTPTDESFSFEVTANGPGCISVVSSGDDGRHRVASAWIYLDDQLVINPERFNQNITTVEQPVSVAPGNHLLRARVASGPGTYIDLAVKVGGTGLRSGLVQGRYLELFNLWSDQQAISPIGAGATLSGQGTVLRFEGLPSGQQSFVVRWRFEIRNSTTCEVVRTLPGEVSVHTPSTFVAVASWDGKDAQGQPVADAYYFYRLVADLIKLGPDGEQVLEEVATAQQPVILDKTPPEVSVVSPLDGQALKNPVVPVQIAWHDPLVNGVASGIDPASAEILLDGVSIAGILSIDSSGATGVVDLSGQQDGRHELRVSISDRAGNQALTQASFLVDTTPPQLAWVTTPPSQGWVGPLTLNFTAADKLSGLVVSQASLDDAVGADFKPAQIGAIHCSPASPDGIRTAVCEVAITLTKGTHTITAHVSDLAGNPGAVSLSLCAMTTCEADGIYCGDIDNGCGERLACGDCTAGFPDFMEQLYAANGGRGDDKLYFRMHPNGGVAYLGGSDIAPGCSVPMELDVPSAQAALRCFLRATAPMHVKDGKPQNPDPIRVTKVENERDGFSFVHAWQFVGDFPVGGSDINMVTYSGNVVQFIGKLNAPDAIRAPAYPYYVADATTLVPLAEQATRMTLTLVRREYSVKEGAVVATFESPAMPARLIVLREPTLELVSIVSTALNHNLKSKITNVEAYPNTTIPPIPPIMSFGVPVEVANPEVDDSRCKYRLDHGSDHDDGEPKVVIARSGEDDGDAYEFWGNCAEGDCALCFAARPTDEGEMARYEAMNAYYWAHDLSVFAHHWRAAYKYWYGWTEPENVKVVIERETKSCPGDDAIACANWGVTEYRIQLPMVTDAPLRLKSMAHEYGHVIHYMYDFGGLDLPWTNPLNSAIAEGFADSNVLRYVMYRWREDANRPYDVMDKAGYSTCDDSGVCSANCYATRWCWHDQELKRGMLAPRNGWDESQAALVHDEWSIVCLSNFEAHKCGSVLTAVYWELAWNLMRASYRGYASPEDSPAPLLQRSAYTSAPEFLASVAYTFAVRSMTSSSSIHDFGAAVTKRYAKERDTGWIDGDEFARVSATLNHHCLGWGNHCFGDKSWLILTQLPVALSNRTTLLDDNLEGTEQLVRVAEMDGVGGTARRLWRPEGGGTGVAIRPAGDVANDQFAVMDGADGSAVFRINVGDREGLYQFAVAGTAVCQDWWNPGCPLSWHVTVDSGYASLDLSASNQPGYVLRWTDPGQAVRLSPGVHEISVSPGPGTFASNTFEYMTLNAALVHRVCPADRSCTDGVRYCGIMQDSCVAQLDCGSCPTGQDCGPYRPHECDCRPLDCAALGGCRQFTDACGNVTDCGACPDGLDWGDPAGDVANPACDLVAGSGTMKEGGHTPIPWCNPFPPFRCFEMGLRIPDSIYLRAKLAASPLPFGSTGPLRISWSLLGADLEDLPCGESYATGVLEQCSPTAGSPYYPPSRQLELVWDPTYSQVQLWLHGKHCGDCIRFGAPICEPVMTFLPKYWMWGNDYAVNIDLASNTIELIIDEGLVRWDTSGSPYAPPPLGPMSYSVTVDCADGSTDTAPPTYLGLGAASVGVVPPGAALFPLGTSLCQ